jgi:tetratricopeptide (TPR) repeat protein
MTPPRITHNPGILGDEELIRSFVVRKESLDLVLEALRENKASPGAIRHMLIVGPRGSGKTMLVRRVAAEIRINPEYESAWFPVVFGEESYPVGTAGEFWLEALFHLSDQNEETKWKATIEELRAESNETRLRERALAQLLDFADARQRRLLLVVENLNMLAAEQMNPEAAWDLRHTLANEPRVMLLGTATSRFDEITNSDRAWFEMFSIHDLRPVSAAECSVLWQSVAGAPLESGPLRAVRILTGGNPRLLAVLASFAAKRSFRELMEQLVQLIDDHTEYFKSHLDALPPKERKVFVALLEHWDPVGAAELARISRLRVNETSTMLGRLVGRGAVEVAEQKGRRRLYQVAERLYNIYYLMRRRGHPAGRVQAAVSFMVMFYEGEELTARIGELAREACGLPAGERQDHYLAYAEIVRRDRRMAQRIIERTPPEFFDEAPEFVTRLTAWIHPEAQPRLASPLQEAYALRRAGQFKEAEDKCREAIAQNHDDAGAWAELGLTLEELGRHEEAEQAFRKAVETDSKNSWNWDGLGAALADLSRYDEAERAFRKAIELNAKESWHWNGLGHVLLNLDRHEEAEQSFHKAIELRPHESWHWHWLGNVLRELDHHEEAEQSFRKAIELRQDQSWHWHGLGNVLQKLGRYEEAEQSARKAIELRPNLAWNWGLLSKVVRALHRLDDAEEALRKAIELEPKAGYYWNWLSSILVEAGRYDEAEIATRKEIEVVSEPAWSSVAILMFLLAAQEKWDEMLSASSPVLDAAATESGARQRATEFLMRAAAAGHARAALEKLTESAGAPALEPLVVGLRIYLGETPQVAKEIFEIGQDVAKRIRVEHREMGERPADGKGEAEKKKGGQKVPGTKSSDDGLRNPKLNHPPPIGG